jgi:hypothetical protein
MKKYPEDASLSFRDVKLAPGSMGINAPKIDGLNCVKHTRTEVTITRYHKIEKCEQCGRPAIKVTCGDPNCQYWHHINLCRKKRKTERIVPCRRKVKS